MPLRNPLTPKELEVVQHLSVGASYVEMAEVLQISRKAIARRLDRAWRKTGTSNRHGIVGTALRNGWIK